MPSLSTDYVFMSYSRRDDAVMRRIVAFLREQGIKVWVDNEKLIPGRESSGQRGKSQSQKMSGFARCAVSFVQ